MVRALTILVLSLAAAGGSVSDGEPASAAAGAVRAVKIGDFDTPTHVENAPGAPRLLFVVEQGGKIQVLRRGRKLRKPFLDITGQVRSGGERGLLSVAFPPNYQRTRRFYVYFTNQRGDIEVDEFLRSPKSQTRAQKGSRRVVLRIRHREFANHNGGQLQFGPDGHLWLATGDGGGGGDTLDNARDRSSLLGKLLRINPIPGRKRSRGHRGRRGFRVPRDNPYVGRKGRNPIYSYGLRNPWRFSFFRRRIAIADVGQSAVEEVNILGIRKARGANFGWPQYEGSREHDPDRPGADDPVFPIHEYGRSGGNCSVTGGYIVRDRRLPALRRRYVYADFCKGVVRSFRPDLKAGKARGDSPIGVEIPSPSSFGEGRRGAIYVTSLVGGVYRLRE